MKRRTTNKRAGRPGEMTSRKPTRGRPARTGFATAKEDRAIIAEHGELVLSLRAQVFLWANLVAEACRQVALRVQDTHAALAERNEHEWEYFRDSKPLWDEIAANWEPMRVRFDGARRFAIEVRTDEWPEGEQKAVEFALSDDHRAVRVHAVGLEGHQARVPENIRNPRDPAEARLLAQERIESAIRILWPYQDPFEQARKTLRGP